VEEVRVIAPTGCLGYGFSREDFARMLDEHQPDVIAVDAGSTDPGPYYLGSGESFTTEVEVAAELEVLIAAALERDVPLVVGSCGGAGADPHVAWTRRVVEDVAARRGWSFRLATIGAEVSRETVAGWLEDGAIGTFESEEPLTAEAVEESICIVAQMGHEPIVEALDGGAQVVLAGRACDDAVFAALPIARGFDVGLALHMGKILECGALAATPIGMDVMLGTLREDHFELVPGSPQRACTLTSVHGHALYEREDPFIHYGPSGTVDLTDAVVSKVDDRRVRVRGTRYEPFDDCVVKLEGVRHSGFRSIAVAGMRCPSMLSILDEILDEGLRRTRNSLAAMGVPGDSYRLALHVYGRDGVMRGLEPRRQVAHEVGLVIEAVADEQALAHSIAHNLAGTLLHLDYPGQYNNAGNLAFPFSPAEIDAGPVFEFSIYHLARVGDPLAAFPVEYLDIGPAAGERAA
jgi:hypothetical protein